MPPDLPPFSEQDLIEIDQYLAGALSESAAEALFSRAAADPVLAAELARQRAFMESLRQAVPGPAAGLASRQLAVAVASVPDGGTPGIAANFLRPVPVSIGIAAALAVAAGVMTWSGAFRTGQLPHETPFGLVCNDGFLPTIAQTDAGEIEEVISEKLACDVVLPRSASVRYLGVRSDVGGSPLSLGVLAVVDERRVLLVLDRSTSNAARGVAGSTAFAGGVFRHEKFIGNTTLTEWSQSTTPLIADRVTAR